MLWTLARDGATPLSRHISRIHNTYQNPFTATFVCACVSCALGAVYVGSSAAFNALVGSFVILSMLSYLAAILPHVLTGRKNVRPGAFWMPGIWGMAVHGVSCAYMLAFIVVFCFPFKVPVDAENMNYSCLIVGGLTLFVALLWAWKRKMRGYESPRVLADVVEL